MRDRYLPVYLQDHMALSIGGRRLAERCLAQNRRHPIAPRLERLVPELRDDERRLERAIELLGYRRARWKELLVIAGELGGRGKLNGQLLGYSPLSRLWELETLYAGSHSRLGLWQALASLRDARLEGLDLPHLEARAREHVRELEQLRIAAAEEAFRVTEVRPAFPAPARR